MPPVDALRQWFESTFIWPHARGEDRHRRLYMVLLILLMIPVGIWMAWDDYQAGRMAEVLDIALLVVPLTASLAVIRFASDIRWGYRLVAAALVVGLTLLLVTGSGEGYAFIWFFFIPAGFCYILGAKEGSIWLAASLLTAFVVVLWDVGTAYPTAMKIRFLLSYTILGMLALGLQRSRDRLMGRLAAEKEQLQQALDEVRTLSEMLPMCAWCGKVRDDEGYWSRIEEYLNSQAGTRVSHGLCPDCERRVSADIGDATDAPAGEGEGA